MPRQHPRPIGPTTNAAAPFIPAMAQGVRAPDKSRASPATHNAGVSLSQTTHGQAAFGPEMAAGARPERSRARLPLNDGGASWTPDVDPFSIEMVAGWMPDAPRLCLGPKIPLPVSQLTHVEAAFSPEMVAGWHPDGDRVTYGPRPAWIAIAPDVEPFSIDMVVGSHPDLPRLCLAPRIPLPQSQPTHTDAAFGPEMTAGWHPDTNRAFIPPKTGWLVAQPTPVAAPFSVEMAVGVTALRHRYLAPFESGWQWLTPDVPVFSIEMVTGSRPDRPRILLGARIPLPDSQLSPVEAPFSLEMVSGVTAPSQRYTAPFHTGWPVTPPDVAVFSIEMVRGWHPDRPMLQLGPRIPLPVSQPTHTAAAFTIDMVVGLTAPRQRYVAPWHSGQQLLTTEVTILTVDMLQGSRPDRPRLFLAPRIPLPVSQTTHVAAPFSLEMSQGAKPAERSHAYEAKKVGWSVSQVTHTEALFAITMVQGSPGIRRAETWVTRRWGSVVPILDGPITFLPDGGEGFTWLVPPRHGTWDASERESEWTVRSRDTTWTVRDRQGTWTVRQRMTVWKGKP